MPASWTGTIYDIGTVTETGNSGWVDMRGRFEGVRPDRISTAWLRVVPSNFAGNETLDLDLNICFDEHGTGDVKIHDFTQITSTNAVENLHVPGLESASDIIGDYGNPAGTVFTSGLPPYWKFTWTVAGTTPSVTVIIYGILVG